MTLVESPAGDAEGIFALRIDEELQDGLYVLEAGNTDAIFLSELGTFLLTELFTGVTADLYRISLGMVRSQQKGAMHPASNYATRSGGFFRICIKGG